MSIEKGRLIVLLAFEFWGLGRMNDDRQLSC